MKSTHALQLIALILFLCHFSETQGAEERVELPEKFLNAIETIKKDQSKEGIDRGVKTLRTLASRLKKDDAVKLYLAAAAKVAGSLYRPQYEKNPPRYSSMVPPELNLPFVTWVDPAEVQDPIKRERYKKALKENDDAKKIIAMQANAYIYFDSIAYCIAFDLRMDTWETKQAVLEECSRLKLPERFRKELEQVFQYKLPVQPPESGKAALKGSKKESEKSPQKIGQ